MNGAVQAKDYFERNEDRERFYRIFYKVCRQFGVIWSDASLTERALIEEAVRVMYEQDTAKRHRLPLSSVSPFFGDMEDEVYSDEG